MSQRFHVTYGVPGTASRVKATKETTRHRFLDKERSRVLIDGIMFSVLKVKRLDYDPLADGYKLYCDLLVNKDGTRTTSVLKALRVFNLLEGLGWEVDKKKFIREHWNR